VAVEGIPGLLRWAPNTSYKAGERFAAPNGDIVTANIDFTSGATYSATNVTPSAQEDRIEALEVLAGFTPGSTTDVSVAGLLGSATDTRNALDARYVNEADAASLVTGMVTGAGSVQTALDARYVNEGTPVSNTEIAGMVTGAGATQTALDARYVNEGTPVSNTEIAGMVTGAGATQTALDTRYAPTAGGKPVGKGELVINVKDYGAKGDGTTDDTAALNAASAAAEAKDFTILFWPAGTYKTTGTVAVRRNLEADQATIAYYGTGTALVLGSTTSGTVTARQRFHTPRVINMSRGTTGWDGTSVGVQANNLNTCELHVPFVQDFEKGLVMYGNAGGNAYNTVLLGALWENHKNLVLDCTADGYTNQNLFLGGRLQHSTTKGATVDDVNAAQIQMVGLNVEGGPNNNTFIGTSFEGENVAYYRVDVSGRYNYFINCRWEHAVGQNPRIRWRSTAQLNKIEGGYATVDLVEVFDGTLGGGEIRDHVGAYSRAGNTAGQVIPNNVWTTVTSWSAPVQRRVSYNGTTGEFTPRPGRWLITAMVSFAANATGRRIARLNVGGTVTDVAEVPGNANRNTLRLSDVQTFDSVKTLKVEVNQTSGADLALETSPPYVRIHLEYLGY